MAEWPNPNIADFNVKDEKLFRQVCQLEEISYPKDEAASADTIYYRGSNANEYFKVYVDTGNQSNVYVIDKTV